MLQAAINFIPVYVLVLFRIAGMMIWAPLLGSQQIPKRIKAMMACVLAASIAPTLVLRVAIPQSAWELALAIAGEIIFGAAIGLILSLIFVAAQWAGEMIGQQMGLNLGQTLNPQYGGGGTVVGDLYFFLTLLIFLSIGGHMALVKACSTASPPCRCSPSRSISRCWTPSSPYFRARWCWRCNWPPPCWSRC